MWQLVTGVDRFMTAVLVSHRRWWKTATWTSWSRRGFTPSTSDRSCCRINPTPSSPERRAVRRARARARAHTPGAACTSRRRSHLQSHRACSFRSDSPLPRSNKPFIVRTSLHRLFTCSWWNNCRSLDDVSKKKKTNKENNSLLRCVPRGKC